MPNFVIVLQKEMFYEEGQVPNYFLGKMDIVTLDPFTPMELLEAYRLQFNTLNPFNAHALLQVARMSRGIFRRYLRYIQLVLEDCIARDLKGEITLEIVKEAVPLEELEKDWHLELGRIFKSHLVQRQAFGLVMHLMGNGPKLQKEIHKIGLGHGSVAHLDKMQVTGLVDRLEENGFIKRQRTENGYVIKPNF